MAKIRTEKKPVKTDDERLEELLAQLAPGYNERPEVIQAAKAQGYNIGGDDEENEEDILEDSEEETETESEKQDTELDTELDEGLQELEQKRQERKKRDTLKKEQSFKAAQQTAADELQKNLRTIDSVRKATTEKVRTRVAAITDKIGSASTPGGLMIPLIILLVLNYFIIPVSNSQGISQPRFIWSWFVLTRRAHLMPETKIPEKGNPTGEKTTQQNFTEEPAPLDMASLAANLNGSSAVFSRYIKG